MPGFRERYCSRHNITYYDSRCPQCRAEEEKQQFEKMIEPLTKAERKREAQKQLRLMLGKLERAIPVQETTRYKRSVCPYCDHPSLFYSSSTGYECHHKGCPLNSSIRFYAENANR